MRELRDFFRLQEESEANRIQIAFYSERDTYLQYYEDLLAALVVRGVDTIHYITSDPHDRMLAGERPHVQAYYIRNSLAATMLRLQARVVVMTMPDLGVFHIKRSPRVASYVYAFHAVSSTHVGYRFNAFDYYDVILCVGPQNVAELRRAEELYGRRPKRLIECGYPRLEAVYRSYQKSAPAAEPFIMLASTWGPESALQNHADALVEAVARIEGRCVVRPHPEFIKREPERLARLARNIARHANLSLDTGATANLEQAELLISDGSGITLEYALGTERPVLFLDCPMRVENPRWSELGIEPIDIGIRSELGKVIGLSELERLPAAVAELRADAAGWRERIAAYRERTVFNWLHSADVGADVLVELAAGTPTGSAASMPACNPSGQSATINTTNHESSI